MILEQQVVSLELAKKLKELGVKQESLFYWVKEYYDPLPLRVVDTKWNVIWLAELVDTISYTKRENLSAFTVAELGLLLPYNTVSGRYEEFAGEEWNCENSVLNVFNIRADTEADARAKMLCYLLENKLLPLH